MKGIKCWIIELFEVELETEDKLKIITVEDDTCTCTFGWNYILSMEVI